MFLRKICPHFLSLLLLIICYHYVYQYCYLIFSCEQSFVGELLFGFGSQIFRGLVANREKPDGKEHGHGRIGVGRFGFGVEGCALGKGLMLKVYEVEGGT